MSPEVHRGFRVIDSDQLDQDSEELGVALVNTVEPIKGLTMFLAEFARDPNNNPRFKARGIGDDLAKVGMVGGLELVLNDYDTITTEVSSDDVTGKVSYRSLGLGHLEFEPKNVREAANVLREPGGEVQAL